MNSTHSNQGPVVPSSCSYHTPSRINAIITLLPGHIFPPAFTAQKSHRPECRPAFPSLPKSWISSWTLSEIVKVKMSLLTSGRQCASFVTSSKLQLRICSSLSTYLKLQSTSHMVRSHSLNHLAAIIRQAYCAIASLYHLLHSYLHRCFYQRTHFETHNFLSLTHHRRSNFMTDVL